MASRLPLVQSSWDIAENSIPILNGIGNFKLLQNVFDSSSGQENLSFYTQSIICGNYCIAAQALALPFAPPYLQPNATFNKGINFASGGSGVLNTTNAGLVRFSSCKLHPITISSHSWTGISSFVLFVIVTKYKTISIWQKFPSFHVALDKHLANKWEFPSNEESRKSSVNYGEVQMHSLEKLSRVMFSIWALAAKTSRVGKFLTQWESFGITGPQAIPLGVQLKQYQNVTAVLVKELGVVGAKNLISKALFLIASGSNDLTAFLILLATASPAEQKQYNATQYISSIIDGYRTALEVSFNIFQWSPCSICQ